MKKVGATLVEPYAEALMALAQEQNCTDGVAEDARGILAALTAEPDLRRVLASPVVKAEAKKALLQSVFQGRVQGLTQTFLLLLIDRQRIAVLTEMLEGFLVRFRKLRGIALAEVTSASALDEGRTEQLRDRLKTLTGARDVEMSIQLDPDLIAGFVVKVESQVLDASLRGQFRNLSGQLLAAV
ncbi:MAG: F0F1 ATP synthase subunit delta [Oscillatoriales cyanobacterium SM2_1_8]|nr:F0F1 ATP synthase subunit delta [Oscillatoriales cyanobacterium SM2_1_8]